MDFADIKQEANNLFRSGQYSEAISLYSSALLNDPPAEFRNTFISNRSMAYFKQNNFYSSMGDSVSLLQHYPDADLKLISKNYYRILECCIQMANVAQGKSWLSNPPNIDPSMASNVKLLKSNISKLETALNKCTNAIKLMRQEELSSGVEELNSLAPHSFEHLYFNVNLSLMKGEFSNAIRLAEGQLQKSPNSSQARFLIAVCYWCHGSVDRSKDILRSILNLDPDFTEAKDFLKKIKILLDLKDKGNKAYSSGDLDAATQLYTDFLNLSREVSPFSTISSQVYCNRSAVYMKQSKFDEALHDANAALEINNDYAKALSRKAQCELQSGDFQNAVFSFERLAKLEPSNPKYQQDLQSARRMLQSHGKKDHYKMLGVERSATADEIKKKYRKESLKVHPDRTASLPEEERKAAEKKFQQISEAYSILGDAEKRRQYDSGELDNPMGGFGGVNMGGMGGGMPIDISDLMSMFMGGGGGGGNPFGNMGGGNPFGNMGGGGRGGQRGNPFGPNVRVNFG
ncbi:hypothetical protein GEMRC1_005795 [Eukaryota sp. GEM-RC1]